MSGRGVRLTLGGKERRLKYDLNAVAEIGDRLGLRIRLGHFEEDLMGAPLPLKALRTLIWAGLVHEDQALTEEQIGGWVDQDNIREVMERFFSVFGATSSVAQDLASKMMGDEAAQSEEPIPEPVTS